MTGRGPGPLLVATVAVGGALGTGARAMLSDAWAHPPEAFPFATATVNVLGAFLLGVLLERLAAAGAETPRRLLMRLGLGTGVLGGLTTFSGLALDVVTLVRAGELGVAAAYGLGSVAFGLVACMVGVLVGARRGVL